MKLKGIILLFVICLAFNGISQEIRVDTIMQLDTVSIAADRYSGFSTGQNIKYLHADIMQQDLRNNIGDILSENTSVYIRSYGPNTLTTMSFRGTSSNQSSIFWNGINLKMPSLGITDLSLIPAGFFNNAAIVFGGSGIRYGSGTIGGAVFLNNQAEFSGHTLASLNLRAGSFGSLGTSVTAYTSGDKFYFKAAFTGHEARNDYYYLSDRGEKKTLENAASNGLGFNGHAALKIAKKNQLDLFLWYQEALREIPPSTTMNTSEAYQSDRAFRTSLQWKSFFRNAVLSLKTAWFTEYENYTDPLISLQSSIQTDTWFFESEYRHQLSGNVSIDAGFSMTAEQADIDAYNGRKERELLAAFANCKYHFSRINWDMMLGARQEFNRDNLFPFTPAIGIEGPLFPFLSHKMSISRNYRLPTMNELYWQPGGNPDIKPENSWNAELSIISEFFRGTEIHGLKFIATAYSALVDDWILWHPQNNFWMADNVKKVWARGIELQTNFHIEKNQKHAELGLSYTYSGSSNESKDAPGDTYGKQLIYTPLHNASGKIGFACSHWYLLLFGNYTGESYTTTDNLSTLPGFYLMDISLKKEFVTKLMNIGIAARLNNIFNKDYQFVAYRPMPGRNFNLSVLLTFKN